MLTHDMLRTAVIGAGGIGIRLAREVSNHPDATIVALVDVSQPTLEEAAEDLGVGESMLYVDEETMYAETDLDAVIIATPPAFHHRQILTAFERDLHVLCEKPVVVDREEARDIAERAASGPNVLMAGYQRHLNPGFIRARERWHDGDLEPTFILGSLTQDWRGHFESGTNWRIDPDVGGRGHLFSVGTHVLESILWITGLTPESVRAEMTFYDDDQEIDQQAALVIRFQNGTIASLGDSAIVPATREHIQVWDDDGAVYLTGEGWGRRSLSLIDQDGNESTPDLDYDGAQGKFEAFVEAIETDSEPVATAEDVVRVTALLDAAYQSAHENRRVSVDLE